MFARSTTAAIALVVFAGCVARSTTVAGLAPNYATGPVRITDKILKDDAGNTVKIRLEGNDAAKAQPLTVTDTAGKEQQIHEYALNDVSLCLPVDRGTSSASANQEPKHPRCEQASSVTDGTFIKFGSASCTCYAVFKTLRCYGTTCP